MVGGALNRLTWGPPTTRNFSSLYPPTEGLGRIGGRSLMNLLYWISKKGNSSLSKSGHRASSGSLDTGSRNSPNSGDDTRAAPARAPPSAIVSFHLFILTLVYFSSILLPTLTSFIYYIYSSVILTIPRWTSGKRKNLSHINL